MSKGRSPNSPDPATHTDGGVDSSRGYTSASCISMRHKPHRKLVVAPAAGRTRPSTSPGSASAPTWPSMPKTVATVPQHSAMVVPSWMPTQR